MGDRVSKEEIETANDIHVVDYLESKGEKLKKEGTYYRHDEHNSLVIHENGKWFWNSRGTGGFGAISFAREFYDLSFQNAVRDVNNQGVTREQSVERLKEQSTQKRDFIYPKEYESATQRNVREYLITVRALEPLTVETLIRKDLIAEDKLKNCVFKWKDKDGKVIGADRQGTVKMNNGNYFKQVVSNSKEDGGFYFDVGKPNKIALFESPIDAASYYDIHKPTDIRLQSMSGLKDRSAATAIKDLVKESSFTGINIEKVIFAVDNDEAGNKFAKRWEHIIGITERHSPKSKDWNEDLQKKKEIDLQRNTTNEIVMEMER